MVERTILGETFFKVGIKKRFLKTPRTSIEVKYFLVIENISRFFREALPKEQNGKVEWVLLLIRKYLRTTKELLTDLARITGINRKNIGYAGLKDRNSVSYQWVSLPATVDLEALREKLEANNPNYKILTIIPTEKKLKIAKHSFNIFFSVVEANSPKIFERSLDKLLDLGLFPNYYGFQRFGWHGENISMIEKQPNVLKKPYFRDVLRSYIFNLCLSERLPVIGPLGGDFIRFGLPTGPIYGEKMPMPTNPFELDLELEIFAEHQKELEKIKKERGWRRTYYVWIDQDIFKFLKMDKKTFAILSILPKGVYFSSLLYELSGKDIIWSFPSSSF